MKKRRSLFYLILAFIFAQIAWMGLLGLWIYWYVTNYIIVEKIGDKLSPHIFLENKNVLVFVGGIVLIVLIAIAMIFFFRDLTVHIKLTGLYDNFIANVTHELKSPLASIQLYLETMNTKDVPSEKRKEFITLMLKDSNRLQKLIDSILEISRLEKKRIPHNYYVYEVDMLIPQIIGNSIEQFRIAEENIKVEGKTGCKIVVDKDSLQIVFNNLVNNSIKYSIEQAEITVRVSLYKNNVMIEFSDKGIGIEPKDQKKVFHKFQRIIGKSIPNVKGTGLGLYQVKEIIKMHGGSVSLYSEGRNKGTTIKIYLPVYLASKKFYLNALLRETARKQKMLEDKND